jgi:trehalose 6-phosphate phosphatase
MKYLFSLKTSEDISRLLSKNTLFAFDFDGTLSKIAKKPCQAGLSLKTHLLLSQLSQGAHTLIISGRSVKNLKHKLGNISTYLIGNHGIENLDTNKRSLSPLDKQCRQWKTILRNQVKANNLQSEIEIEDKQFSLSIHYRCSNNKTFTKNIILSWISNLHPAPRVVLGKSVINLLPQKAPNKGTALISAMKKLHLDQSIYIGDDVTDEDVFGLKSDYGRVFSIRVGLKKSSKATYYIKNQTEINRLLKLLLKLKQIEQS